MTNDITFLIPNRLHLKKSIFVIKNQIVLKILLLIILFLGLNSSFAQTPLFRQVQISDVGFGNNIGNANTSRNLAITDDGIIYAVFVGSEGVRVAKSINRGQSFLPSVQIDNARSVEPEIAVNNQGFVFVSWVASGSLFFSRSTDEGGTFSVPQVLGRVSSGGFGSVVHMTTFENNVYLRDRPGVNFFRNSTNGSGPFIQSRLPRSDVFSDVRTDVNGVVHLPSDDPTLYLFNSPDNGNTIREVNLSPRGDVFFSSYALSDSPAGTFIFVAGNGTNGYKIEAETGIATRIQFRPNNATNQGRTLFADNFGALVDGYRTFGGDIKMSISYDQGVSFPLDITINDAVSHNIERNPLEDDLDVIYERNGQVFMDVFDGLLRSIRLIEPVVPLNLCQGESSTISFRLVGAFINNSEFFLFLSDENGSFENKIQVGFIDSQTSGDISISIPNTIPSSDRYRLQIQSPANFIQSNTIPIRIGSMVEAGVPTNIQQCDSGNGTAVFDLTSKNAEIANGITGAVINYFTSENDAETGNNPITNSAAYSSNSSSVWVRLEDPATRCSSFAITSFEIIVSPLPNILQVVSDLELCDDIFSGSDTDGLVTFDLTTKIDEILGSQNPNDFEVNFFLDNARTLLISNPQNFTNNTRGSQTIYVTVTDKSGLMCMSNTSFNSVVIPLPTLISSNIILKQCDDDADGISSFNLNEANRLLSTNFLTENFKYYTTLALAEIGADNTEISNPETYINPSAIGSEVYARIENNDGNNCFRTAIVELQVGVSNIPQTFFDALQIISCDDGVAEAEYTDGISAFDLSSIVSGIDTFFSPLNVTTTFYESQENALSEQNQISDLRNYRNSIPNRQQIFVRVDGDINNDCQGFGDFEITVNPIPIKKNISNLISCGTTTAQFDLTQVEGEIIDNQPNIDVFYFRTALDRVNNIPIVNPSNFVSAAQTIYVQSLNTVTNCVNNDLQFNVLLDNVVLAVPNTINRCNVVEETIYDLTVREEEIANGDTSITFEYFENTIELLANNFISDPENYLSEELINSILVRGTNENGCTGTTNLELITTLFVAINTTPNPLLICDIGNDGLENFDLTIAENDIIAGAGIPSSNFEFKYYFTEIDAENNNSNEIPFPSNFQNSIPNEQTVFVRVIQAGGSNCFEIVPIVVKTILTPKVTISEQYVICSNSNNERFSSEQETVVPQLPIDTNLSELDFSFRWFRGIGTAIENLIPSEIGATFIPESPGIYTVEVTESQTGLNCKYSATTEVIRSSIAESISVNQSSSVFADNTIIEITVAGLGEYEYSNDNQVWQLNNRFENVLRGESTFYVRDIYNCEVQSEKIDIVDYPRFFTPNNDGINDTWSIDSSNEIQVSNIQIFNRYGKLLKTLLPNGEKWDGTYIGTSLPSEDYWFIVKYKDNISAVQKEFKSSFTLKR